MPTGRRGSAERSGLRVFEDILLQAQSLEARTLFTGTRAAQARSQSMSETPARAAVEVAVRDSAHVRRSDEALRRSWARAVRLPNGGSRRGCGRSSPGRR